MDIQPPIWSPLWLIKPVKKILHFVLKEQEQLDDETLQTALCEVESIMNDRPLTTVFSDPNDLEPLTPNHLLQLKAKPGRSVFSAEMETGTGRDGKWHSPKRNLRPDDLVIIVDDTAPRSSWLMGRVVKALPGPGGLIRTVVVKTKSSILQRPIDKLCLLLEADHHSRYSRLLLHQYLPHSTTLLLTFIVSTITTVSLLLLPPQPPKLGSSAVAATSTVAPYHCLKSDVSYSREPVEVMEGEGHLGEIWQVKHKACCSVLDTLQRFDCRDSKSSQEQVAVVEVGDDERLDQELCCFPPSRGRPGSCRCCLELICRIGPLRQFNS
ncbi:hypothetical protein N1851_028305 [Merluccius polli]|uniref:DUF5641 domain-containing protein n=1 Tax=Merluccius polli TaxID=89951 RepID=A0AA47M8U0_MERPO|nr:hypothetical protein N1851_028305 [Merluccius polli]